MATSTNAFAAASNCPETEENLPPENDQSDVRVIMKSNHIQKAETTTVSMMTSSSTTTTTTFGALTSMCWSTSGTTTLCKEKKNHDHDEAGGERTTITTKRTTTTTTNGTAATHTTTATTNATVNTKNEMLAKSSSRVQILDGAIAILNNNNHNYPYRRHNKLTVAQRQQHKQHRQYRHHRLSEGSVRKKEEIRESTIGAPSSLSSSSSSTTSSAVATKYPPPIARMHLDNLHTTQCRKPDATTQMTTRSDTHDVMLSPSTVPQRFRDRRSSEHSDASWTGATMIESQSSAIGTTKLFHFEEVEEDYWKYSKITHSTRWYRTKNRISRHSQCESSLMTITNAAHSTDPPGEKVEFLFEDHHLLSSVATTSSSPTSVQLAVQAHHPPTKRNPIQCMKNNAHFGSELHVNNKDAVVHPMATSSPPPPPIPSLLSPIIIDLTQRPTVSSFSNVVSTKLTIEALGTPKQPTESPASNQNATMSSMKTVSFRYPVHEIISFPQDKHCDDTNNIRRSNNDNDSIDVSSSLYKVDDWVDIVDGMHKDRTGHVVKVSSHGLIQVALLNCWNQSLYLSPVMLQHRETKEEACKTVNKSRSSDSAVGSTSVPVGMDLG